jgi:hypothetical protein
MQEHVTILETVPYGGVNPELPNVVRRALEHALTGVSKLTPEMLAVQGMSGRKYRSFVNNLVEYLPSPHYLEVGSWGGSTLCSAVFGNDVDAVAIDNWSEFGGPFRKFFGNLAEFKGTARVSFLERDFRKVDYTSLGQIFGPFGIYLFDGPHGFNDQYEGITRVQPCLEARYVQIVDDWNWASVRGGTLEAIAHLGLHIDFMAEIRTTFDDTHAPEPVMERSDWHNGYFIGVLSRPA